MGSLAVTLPDLASRTHTYVSLADSVASRWTSPFSVAQTPHALTVKPEHREGWLSNANRSATGEYMTITFVPCLWPTDRRQYAGEVVNGIPHGQGRMTYKDGSHYDGEWARGKRHGQGTMHWTEMGETYEGNWEAGRRQGQGRMTYADGGVYVGAFADDRRHGWGRFTPADNEERPSIGRWENDGFDPIAQHAHQYQPMTLKEYKRAGRAVRKVHKQLTQEAERHRRLQDLINGVKTKKKKKKKKKKRAW